MFKIKTLNHISEKGLDLFPINSYAVSDGFEDADAFLVRSQNLNGMTFNDNLLCIARAGAGTNNIPVDKCTEQGIVVFNTPGANANAVKELVLLGMFLVARNVLDAIQWLNTLEKNDDLPKIVEKEKARFVGTELAGKTLGVLGLGAIGAKVANAANALGLTVLGHDPYISVKHAWGLSRQIIHAETIDDVTRNCDYITVHVPLMNTTVGMINEKLISSMKDGVTIINMSRGEIVNTNDLLKALDSGKVAYYVTDFPDKNIVGHPRVIAIPHLGASTVEAEENCAIMAVQQIMDYLENGNIVNSVNFPECQMHRTAKNRLTVCHKNIPNMVGQISTFLAQSNINIENMLNRSKGENAYSIIDYEGDITPELVGKIQNIEGVLRTRVI
ncbi:MAG: phosphoglycerate dehydrogenase [Clostridia bacterium]|jgi:D-3-phosphoglycerate dehydrogenase